MNGDVSRADKPIRIAYIVNRFATGGVKSLLTSYFRHIDHDKFEIEFIACRDSSAEIDYSEIKNLGGSVIESAPVSNPFSYVFDCTRILKQGEYDIVQACMSSLNVFPLLAAKMASIPVRISYNLSTSHPGEGKTIAKNALRIFGSLFATGRAANSELAWDWLFGEKSLSDRTIIPNAVDLDVYGFDGKLRERTRAEMGWNNFFVVGHIGRFEYQKNHLFLVEVFKEILVREPRARLALVGYGSMKERVFDRMDELGIGDAVFDLGTTEDLNGLYNAFDCFVMPSFYEGLPVVGIEAQATGCPCVFSSEVTRETGAIDQVEFVPLSEPAARWAETVLRFDGIERSDGREAVASHGFEAKRAARSLERYYLTRLDRSETRRGQS